MTSHKSPLVSFLLPILNAEAFLSESIESVLTQSFGDFELIAIDDGSSDSSLEILRQFASKDSRVRVFSRDNKGLVVTLNEGIARAHGYWLARMDADDVATPNRIEIQIAQLVSTGSDFCGGWVRCFGASSQLWRYPLSHEGCAAHLLFDVPVAHPAVVGRTDAFKALGYREEAAHAEDYDLWHRAFNAGYRFTNVQEVVLKYRVSDSQISSRHQGAQRSKANLFRSEAWLIKLPRHSERTRAILLDAVSDGLGSTKFIMPLLREVGLGFMGGEPRNVFLAGCYRLFCKMAGHNPLAALDWWRLTQGSRLLERLRSSILLFALSVLRLRVDGPVFSLLKRCYVKWS